MTGIVWTDALTHDYLAGFQVGRNLVHRVPFFSEELGKMVAEPTVTGNADPVLRTALSYLKKITGDDLESGKPVESKLTLDRRTVALYGAPRFSYLDLGTSQCDNGATLGVWHRLNLETHAYITSNFHVVFADGAWALGLEKCLGVSEDAEPEVIMKRAFRRLGMRHDTPMKEYWSNEYCHLVTERQLCPGGPGVRVSFNRSFNGREDRFVTGLEVSVQDINPVRPYLPGGVLELWRLAARLAASPV